MGAIALHGILPASASAGSEESCFLSAINAARTSAGAAPLSTNGDLLGIARAWSQAMADAGHIFHDTNIPNVAPSNWQTLGENVGVGPTCDSIAQAFMNSPEHRKNILDTSYTTVGVGVVDTADGTIYVTEDFMGTGSVAAPPPAPKAAPPVVTNPPAPAPKVTIPAPRVTVPVPAAPAPKPTVAAPKPAVPAAATVVKAVEKPAVAAAPAPTMTEIPVATPIFDQTVTVQSDQAPASAPIAGHAHHGGLHDLLSAIGSFFSHLL